MSQQPSSEQPTARSAQQSVTELINRVVAEREPELIALRRDIHMHPELSWAETRTTEVVAEEVAKAGWEVTRLESTGLVADLGEGDPLVALRADIDALPVTEESGEEFSSLVEGVTHACGHDVHTTVQIGAAQALAEVQRQGLLPGRVRLLFQPAEEVMPGGAMHLVAEGSLSGVDRIFALHCDPGFDVGRVGLRTGALTSAADKLEVRLEGTGGHTSRPHLTGDLTFALAKVVTELPAIVSRRMDPRSGVSVVWGRIQAGSAPNVIPHSGIAAGTVRILDAVAWADCEPMIREAIGEIVRPYGVTAHVDYQRGVPPVVNDAQAAALMAAAVREAIGPRAAAAAPQSLGGEDFGWYLEQVPGSMARLGIRTPGGPTYDLHQGNLRIDERAISVGSRVLAATAVRSLLTEVTDR